MHERSDDSLRERIRKLLREHADQPGVELIGEILSDFHRLVERNSASDEAVAAALDRLTKIVEEQVSWARDHERAEFAHYDEQRKQQAADRENFLTALAEIQAQAAKSTAAIAGVRSRWALLMGLAPFIFGGIGWLVGQHMGEFEKVRVLAHSNEVRIERIEVSRGKDAD